MTIVQKLEQKGLDKGIQLGEQLGIEKGEREATQKIVRTMLQSGIDRNTVMAMTGLTKEDLTDITGVLSREASLMVLGSPVSSHHH